MNEIRQLIKKRIKKLQSDLTKVTKKLRETSEHAKALSSAKNCYVDMDEEVESIEEFLKEKEGVNKIDHVIDSFFEYGEGKELIGIPELVVKCEKYKSPVLKCPTQEDILNAANDSIYKNDDFHHIFLEGYNLVKKTKKRLVIEIFFGS